VEEKYLPVGLWGKSQVAHLAGLTWEYRTWLLIFAERLAVDGRTDTPKADSTRIDRAEKSGGSFCFQ
jgi:hypothetical protein